MTLTRRMMDGPSGEIDFASYLRHGEFGFNFYVSLMHLFFTIEVCRNIIALYLLLP